MHLTTTLFLLTFTSWGQSSSTRAQNFVGKGVCYDSLPVATEEWAYQSCNSGQTALTGVSFRHPFGQDQPWQEEFAVHCLTGMEVEEAASSYVVSEQKIESFCGVVYPTKLECDRSGTFVAGFGATHRCSQNLVTDEVFALRCISSPKTVESLKNCAKTAWNSNGLAAPDINTFGCPPGKIMTGMEIYVPCDDVVNSYMQEFRLTCCDYVEPACNPVLQYCPCERNSDCPNPSYSSIYECQSGKCGRVCAGGCTFGTCVSGSCLGSNTGSTNTNPGTVSSPDVDDNDIVGDLADIVPPEVPDFDSGKPKQPKNPCFAHDSQVLMADGVTSKPIQDIKVGEKVLSGDGNIAEVVFLPHADQSEFLDPTNSIDYLGIDCSTVMDGIDSETVTLYVTAQHYLFLQLDDEKAKPAAVEAGIVQVGDWLELAFGEACNVTKIDTLTFSGAYSLFTTTGTMIVNGIVVSSYAKAFLDFDNDMEEEMLEELWSWYSHKWAHRIASFHRTMYALGWKNEWISFVHDRVPNFVVPFVHAIAFFF